MVGGTGPRGSCPWERSETVHSPSAASITASATANAGPHTLWRGYVRDTSLATRCKACQPSGNSTVSAICPGATGREARTFPLLSMPAMTRSPLCRPEKSMTSWPFLATVLVPSPWSTLRSRGGPPHAPRWRCKPPPGSRRQTMWQRPCQRWERGWQPCRRDRWARASPATVCPCRAPTRSGCRLGESPGSCSGPPPIWLSSGRAMAGGHGHETRTNNWYVHAMNTPPRASGRMLLTSQGRRACASWEHMTTQVRDQAGCTSSARQRLTSPTHPRGGSLAARRRHHGVLSGGAGLEKCVCFSSPHGLAMTASAKVWSSALFKVETVQYVKSPAVQEII